MVKNPKIQKIKKKINPNAKFFIREVSQWESFKIKNSPILYTIFMITLFKYCFTVLYSDAIALNFCTANHRMEPIIGVLNIGGKLESKSN